MKTKVIVEYQDKKVDVQKVRDAVRKVAPKAAKLDIYIKPEEGKAYYVADGKTYGDDCFVDL